MKKIIFFLTITIIFLTGSYPQQEDIYLKIPVRIYKGGDYLTGLQKDNFTLKINGKVRSITEVLTGERSINDISERRNFILQFNLTDYGKNITTGIEFIINEILRKKDNLIVWTPVKVYRIRSDKPKNTIITDIEKIVKEDSFSYKRLKDAARNKLTTIIRKFIDFIPNKKDSNPHMSNIFNFLNNYSREWLDFKSKFLLPDIGKYYGVFALLSREYPGEKYFINFQQREVIPSLKKYTEAKNMINTYVSNIAGTSESSYTSSISNALKKIDKSMLLSDNFDPAKLVSPFKGANISYNLLLFHSFRQSGDESDSLSPDLEGILRRISRSTGGFSINTNDIRDGINSMMKKSDHYYFLIYKFNGKKGKKKVEVEIDDKEAVLFFKDKFFPDEIDLLIKLAAQPKINISEVNISGKQLFFAISDYAKRGKEKKTGIIKVEIRLLDKNRKKVMEKMNTLRAEKDPVRISLKITPELKGFFKLEISAKDMNRNKTANYSKYIELK
ncbi:MAG: hypothetical protein ABFR36_05260 [Acidobacteriota bacterium]